MVNAPRTPTAHAIVRVDVFMGLILAEPAPEERPARRSILIFGMPSLIASGPCPRPGPAVLCDARPRICSLDAIYLPGAMTNRAVWLVGTGAPAIITFVLDRLDDDPAIANGKAEFAFLAAPRHPIISRRFHDG